MAKGRVSSRVAVSQSPACNASRIRLDEITPPASSTGPTAVLARPRGEPSAFSTATLPPRALPKVKAKPFKQDFFDKILRAGSRQISVKFKHQHGICACRGKQPLPLIKRCQTERRGIGRKIAHRVRIECSDNGWLARRLGLTDRFTCDGLMAQMKAIKIAKRRYAAAQGIGHRVAGG
jgi:hypothetical protein